MRFRTSLLAMVVFLATLAVVYGQDLPQNSAADAQGVTGYLLGPGDIVDVRVFGQPELNAVAEVDDDGNLSSLPFLDPIPAKCRTEKQVQKDIATAYARYLKSAQISVRITERKSRPPATINGAVKNPTQFLMLRTIRLNELITKSGGLTERASGKIQILHTVPVMCPAPGESADPVMANGAVPINIVKISDHLANKPGANPIIRPGDYVSIVEAEPVYIMGMVVNPTGIYMRDKLTLGVALAMVGGVRKEGKATDVRISRLKVGSDERELIRVDYAAIKKNQKPDFMLQAFDVIEVPESSPFSGPRLVTTLLSGLTQAVGSFSQIIPTKVLY